LIAADRSFDRTAPVTIATAPPPRLLPLEGCLNFRDLGGYQTEDGRRVRWRRLFRSDALHHMTPEDFRYVRDTIRISTVIDLRSSAERARDPAPTLGVPAVREHHVPLIDRERSGSAPSLGLDEIYLTLLRLAGPQMVRIVQIIAESRGPALFYCAAGKDRTGLVAAVLLGALGVRDEDVIGDYAATRANLARIVERLRRSTSYDYVFRELPPDTLHAEPETMARVLARVAQEHESMRAYLLRCGLTNAELTRLEAELLEQV